MEPRLAEHVELYLGRMIEEGGPTDLVAAFAEPVAGLVSSSSTAPAPRPPGSAASAAYWSGCASRAKVPSAIMFLRYVTVMHAGSIRAAGVDMDFDGHRFTAGDAVSLSLAAANRDPALCDDPDRLDITRPPVAHLSFGYGIHQCVGQQLARWCRSRPRAARCRWSPVPRR
ncbi:cytochrome P450 [Streptomyces qaidamensis]|uniref:cytochrome P450 n=1 Tax=Streptomyces qaidamensis TaxID=1783515 RepID=UPI0036596EF2